MSQEINQDIPCSPESPNPIVVVSGQKNGNKALFAISWTTPCGWTSRSFYIEVNGQVFGPYVIPGFVDTTLAVPGGQIQLEILSATSVAITALDEGSYSVRLIAQGVAPCGSAQGQNNQYIYLYVAPPAPSLLLGGLATGSFVAGGEGTQSGSQVVQGVGYIYGIDYLPMAPGTGKTLTFRIVERFTGLTLVDWCVFAYSAEINFASATPTGAGAAAWITHVRPHTTGGTGANSWTGITGNISASINKRLVGNSLGVQYNAHPWLFQGYVTEGLSSSPQSEFILPVTSAKPVVNISTTVNDCEDIDISVSGTNPDGTALTVASTATLVYSFGGIYVASIAASGTPTNAGHWTVLLGDATKFDTEIRARLSGASALAFTWNPMVFMAANSILPMVNLQLTVTLLSGGMSSVPKVSLVNYDMVLLFDWETSNTFAGFLKSSFVGTSGNLLIQHEGNYTLLSVTDTDTFDLIFLSVAPVKRMKAFGCASLLKKIGIYYNLDYFVPIPNATLEGLTLSGVQNGSSLDLRVYPALKEFELGSTNTFQTILLDNPALELLDLFTSGLTAIDITLCPALVEINMTSSIFLASVTVGWHPNLLDFNLRNTGLNMAALEAVINQLYAHRGILATPNDIDLIVINPTGASLSQAAVDKLVELVTTYGWTIVW